jgi:hypothetical protein
MRNRIGHGKGSFGAIMDSPIDTVIDDCGQILLSVQGFHAKSAKVLVKPRLVSKYSTLIVQVA